MSLNNLYKTIMINFKQKNVMKNNKNYSPAQTEAFKANRNAETRDYQRRLQPIMVHESVRLITTTPLGIKFLVPLRSKGKTFIGSIRAQFTGPRRNNFK